MAVARQRQLGRLMRRRRRTAPGAERTIRDYRFPAQVEKRLRHRRGLDEESWALVDRGLREWFVCCAWRSPTTIGMPSRLVDEAWHEFILDTIAYADFCDRAFGFFLHHTPDEAMDVPMGDALAETVRAWDRSREGRKGEESVLWDLDEQVGIDDPLRLSGLTLAEVRASTPAPSNYLPGGFGMAGAGGHHGGGHGGGGGN